MLSAGIDFRLWNRRLLIGRDGRLDQSKAYDISQLVREYGPWRLKSVPTLERLTLLRLRSHVGVKNKQIEL